MSNEVIVVGWVNQGKVAQDGESMKNQLMIKRLEELGVKCHVMDFYHWKRHPWVLIKLGWYMVAHRQYTIILSSSVLNVYPMMKLMKIVGWKQNTVHWVIGGSIGDRIKNGSLRSDVLNYVNWTIIESPAIKEDLEKAGITSVLQLPNFKPINYYPNIDERISSARERPLRFVFLSRIIAEKGCDYIMEAAKQLNEQGLEAKYSIDFYGKIDASYEDEFKKKSETLSNVSYKGFLNLREDSGYDQLSQYDVMLFPTYWRGECFAGVFIDAFISGVPLLASDWAHNREFLKEGETALFVPVHDIVALRNKMSECIEGKYALANMARLCQKHAGTYSVDNVITKGLLHKVGILNKDETYKFSSIEDFKAGRVKRSGNFD